LQVKKRKVKEILGGSPETAHPAEGKPYVAKRVVPLFRQPGNRARLLTFPYDCFMVKRLDFEKGKQ
jgi:hypothetical protein